MSSSTVVSFKEAFGAVEAILTAPEHHLPHTNKAIHSQQPIPQLALPDGAEDSRALCTVDEELETRWLTLEAQLADLQQCDRTYFQTALRMQGGNPRADSTPWEDGNTLDARCVQVVRASLSAAMSTCRPLCRAQAAMRRTIQNSEAQLPLHQLVAQYTALTEVYELNRSAIRSACAGMRQFITLLVQSTRMTAPLQIARAAVEVMEDEQRRSLTTTASLVAASAAATRGETRPCEDAPGTVRPSTAPHSGAATVGAVGGRAAVVPSRMGSSIPAPPATSRPPTAAAPAHSRARRYVGERSASAHAASSPCKARAAAVEVGVLPPPRLAERAMAEAIKQVESAAGAGGGESTSSDNMQKVPNEGGTPRGARSYSPRAATASARRGQEERAARAVAALPEEARIDATANAIRAMINDSPRYRTLGLAEKQILQEFDQKELLFHHKRALNNMRLVAIRVKLRKGAALGDERAVAELCATEKELLRQVAALLNQRGRDVKAATLGLARLRCPVQLQAALL